MPAAKSGSALSDDRLRSAFTANEAPVMKYSPNSTPPMAKVSPQKSISAAANRFLPPYLANIATIAAESASFTATDKTTPRLNSGTATAVSAPDKTASHSLVLLKEIFIIAPSDRSSMKSKTALLKSAYSMYIVIFYSVTPRRSRKKRYIGRFERFLS